MDTKQSQTNIFNGGMVLDTHPLNTPNNVLTDCINGTIITNDGHELILQNDQGNTICRNIKLKEGYVPIGIKEYRGTIYIVSYNPENDITEYGSYPSCVISGSNDETKSSNIELDFSTLEKMIDNTETSETKLGEILYSNIINSFNSESIVINKVENADKLNVTCTTDLPFIYYKIKSNNTYLYDSNSTLTYNEDQVIDIGLSSISSIDLFCSNIIFLTDLYDDLYHNTLTFDLNYTINVTDNNYIFDNLWFLIDFNDGACTIEKKLNNKYVSNIILNWNTVDYFNDLSTVIKIIPYIKFKYNEKSYRLTYDNATTLYNLDLSSLSGIGNKIFKYRWQKNDYSSMPSGGTKWTRSALYININNGFASKSPNVEYTLKPLVIKNGVLDLDYEKYKHTYTFSNSTSNVHKFLFDVGTVDPFTGNGNIPAYPEFWQLSWNVNYTENENTYSVTGKSIIINYKSFWTEYNPSFDVDSIFDTENYNDLSLNDWLDKGSIINFNPTVTIRSQSSMFKETSIDDKNTDENIKNLVNYSPIIGSDSIDISKYIPHIINDKIYKIELNAVNISTSELYNKAFYKVFYKLPYDTGEYNLECNERLASLDTFAEAEVAVSSSYTIDPSIISSTSNNIYDREYISDLFKVYNNDDVYYLTIRCFDTNNVIDYRAIRVNDGYELSKEDADKVLNFLNSHVYYNKLNIEKYSYIVENNDDDPIVYSQDDITISNIDINIVPVYLWLDDTLNSKNVYDNPNNYNFGDFLSIKPLVGDSSKEFMTSSVNYAIILNADDISSKENTFKTYVNDYYLKQPIDHVNEVCEDLQYPLIYKSDENTLMYAEKYPDEYNLDILANVKLINNKLVFRISDTTDVSTQSDDIKKLDFGIKLQVNDNIDMYYSASYK